MENQHEFREKLHVEILMVVRDAQQQHGLRHKDYHSYHQYISKKLHRMRKSLNFQQGNRKMVVPKKMNRSMLTDSRYLLIKLFEAERSWAFAMQLKSDSNTEPRKVFHMRSRMKKAVRQAKELLELCRWEKCDRQEGVEECEQCAYCDAHTYVEAQAYLYWMEAVHHFEMEEWKKAKIAYEKAYREYSGLSKAVDEDHKNFYVSKADELTPLIRYCATNDGDYQQQNSTEMSALQQAASGDMDQFNDLLKQIYKNQMAVMIDVHWLSNAIPVKQENVRLAILSLNDSNKELVKPDLVIDAKIKIYDSLLKAFTDALSIVRDDMKASGVTNQAQITNQDIDNLNSTQILFVYLHYVKLTKTVERNLLIIENNSDMSSQKPQNTARLYDTVIQNLQEMAGLPGLNRESHDNSGQQELQAKIAAYTAFRCYYLSQAHLMLKRYTECAALLHRTRRHCDTALAALHVIAVDDAEAGVAVGGRLIPGPLPADVMLRVRALIDTVEADQLNCRASRCLSLMEDSRPPADVHAMSEVSVDEPLWRRLDEFVEDSVGVVGKKTTTVLGQSTAGGGRLIDTPPDFLAIPVKPVFFDLACHHVQFPSLDDKVKDNKKKAAESRGITGMVKGWIWGSN